MNGAALISASIQGGALALAVWLIVLAMPTMPPLAKVWLWRLVFLKFALGFVGIGNIPLAVLPPPPAPEVTVSATADDSVAYEALDSGSVTMPLVLSEPPKRVIPWGWLWLAGVGVMGAHALSGASKTARMVRRAQPVTESWALHDLSELAHAAGIRKVPRLLESAETKTALLAWSLRPAILLPAGLVAEGSDVSADIRLMLAHEVAHLVNRDLIWNLLAACVKGAFFFHPLVWLSAGRSRVAQETAADERAVRMTGTSLKEYGEMLLRATVASNAFRAIPGAVAIAGSVRALRERLNAMSKLSEKPPLALRIAAFAAIAALFPGYCLVAKAQVAPPAKPAQAAPAKKVKKPSRRTYVKQDEGTLIVNAEGNTLAFISSPQRTTSDWIRFDPVTGNVTDGWRMNSTWDGTKYGNPVWTRIDPVTKKKMVIRDDGNSTWTRVVNGKVVAVRRRGKVVRSSAGEPSYGITMPAQFTPAPGRAVALPSEQPAGAGVSVPTLTPPPRAQAGGMPGQPGTAPSIAAGGAPPSSGAAPAVAAGGPPTGPAGIAPPIAMPGGAAADSTAPGISAPGAPGSAPALAPGGGLPSEMPAQTAPVAGAAAAQPRPRYGTPLPPRQGATPGAPRTAGSVPTPMPPRLVATPGAPGEVPPTPDAVAGGPVRYEVAVPARVLPPAPKATKKTPKHRKHHTAHKPK